MWSNTPNFMMAPPVAAVKLSGIAPLSSTERFRTGPGWRPFASGDECDGKSGHELHQIGLPTHASLPVQAADVGPDRGLRNAKRLRHLGHAADLDHGEHPPQFGRRQRHDRAIATAYPLTGGSPNLRTRRAALCFHSDVPYH